MIDGKQKALAIAAHIGYLFFGVGYVLVPLALYLLYDKNDEFIAGHAKQALIVQVITGIFGAIAAALTMLLIGVLLWPIVFLLGAAWFICSILACFKVLSGQEYHYPGLGRFC